MKEEFNISASKYLTFLKKIRIKEYKKDLKKSMVLKSDYQKEIDRHEKKVERDLVNEYNNAVKFWGLSESGILLKYLEGLRKKVSFSYYYYNFFKLGWLMVILLDIFLLNKHVHGVDYIGSYIYIKIIFFTLAYFSSVHYCFSYFFYKSFFRMYQTYNFNKSYFADERVGRVLERKYAYSLPVTFFKSMENLGPYLPLSYDEEVAQTLFTDGFSGDVETFCKVITKL